MKTRYKYIHFVKTAEKPKTMERTRSTMPVSQVSSRGLLKAPRKKTLNMCTTTANTMRLADQT